MLGLIARAMRGHSTSAGVHVAACRLVRALAQDPVAHSGLVAAVCAALRLLGRNAAVAREVLLTLCVLEPGAVEGRCVEAVECIFGSMDRFVQDEGVQVAGCEALSALATSSQRLHQALASGNAAARVRRALVEHPGSDALAGPAKHAMVAVTLSSRASRCVGATSPPCVTLCVAVPVAIAWACAYMCCLAWVGCVCCLAGAGCMWCVCVRAGRAGLQCEGRVAGLVLFLECTCCTHVSPPCVRGCGMQ